MPRKTAKPKQYVNGASCASTITPKVGAKAASTGARKRTVVEDTKINTAPEQVFHRKSERRRIARDIFLIFEHQSVSRRSKGLNKKQIKPKFGHLKVEDPVRTKGLLRDIKNEPKCTLGINHEVSLCSDTKKLNYFNGDSKPCLDAWNEKCQSGKKIHKNGKVKGKSKGRNAEKSIDVEGTPIARVNPIFLWAKQDNTRIIEVRCEDYDKRNRIRITKTSNGWRAIPRSDPTSSKVLKLYTSPLVKVKRENHVQESSNISQATICNLPIGPKLLVVPENSAKNTDLKNTSNLEAASNSYSSSKGSKKLGRHSRKKKSKKTLKCLLKDNVSGPDSKLILVHTIPQANNHHKLEGYSNGSETSQVIYPVPMDNGSEGEIFEPELITEPSVCDTVKHQSLNSHLIESTALSQKLTEHLQFPPLENECSMQLCPKTGLFLLNNEVLTAVSIDGIDSVAIDEIMPLSSNKENKLSPDSKICSVEENTESLEANTRNLKDLLDNADLFQHCDDNANSDAELIDTLVKSTCESNLIQEDGVKESLNMLQSKMPLPLEGNNGISHLIPGVSEPPKCLSFNEAGEIEGLNCELFQPSIYIDTFEKQSSSPAVDSQLVMQSVASMEPITRQSSAVHDNITSDINSLSGNEKGTTEIAVDESPKDLSYKKREEVCPPSESRSQCAVTSSSDIINSSNIDESSAFASSSETLKNIIIEQFMKLNTISKLQPIEFNKPDDDISNLSAVFSRNSKLPNATPTVIIHDDDSATNDEIQSEIVGEPITKRVRLDAASGRNLSTSNTIKKPIVMTDKDPDPLTQLRLLVRNSQWKVPDPILVPKDRLSAVLASPAREIPLLITTRPELRLPEAFAYPEIIQNPNILVISMAQLEAILKNDLEIQKNQEGERDNLQPLSDSLKQTAKYNRKSLNNQLHKNQDSVQTPSRPFTEDNSISASAPFVAPTKEARGLASNLNSNVQSELNSTMAVLKQMLWLPYFSQLSQEFLKSPHLFPTKISQIMPLCGLQSTNTQTAADASEKMETTQLFACAQNINSGKKYDSTETPSATKPSQTDDLAVFQKLLQHQVQNTINSSQANNAPNADVSNRCAERVYNESVTKLKNNTFPARHTKRVGDNSQLSSKTYNLRSLTAFRQPQNTNYTQCPKFSENKPRLTCKSLSNLLDPEHTVTRDDNTHTSSDVSELSLPETNETHNIDLTCSKNVTTTNGGCAKGVRNYSATKVPPRQMCLNNADGTKDWQEKQKSNRPDMSPEESGKNVEGMNETNVPLWHPLFGSNSKSAYSSPWQWTTVTATGE